MLTAGLMWAPLSGPKAMMARVTATPNVSDTMPWLAPSATLPQPTATMKAVPKNSPVNSLRMVLGCPRRFKAFVKNEAAVI